MHPTWRRSGRAGWFTSGTATARSSAGSRPATRRCTCRPGPAPPSLAAALMARACSLRFRLNAGWQSVRQNDRTSGCVRSPGCSRSSGTQTASFWPSCRWRHRLVAAAALVLAPMGYRGYVKQRWGEAARLREGVEEQRSRLTARPGLAVEGAGLLAALGASLARARPCCERDSCPSATLHRPTRVWCSFGTKTHRRSLRSTPARRP